MTQEQVREIVKITIDELTKRKLINATDYTTALKVIGCQLDDFFNSKSDSISHILRQLSDDPYIDIIFLQYRDGQTLERIAEYFEVDVSTIKRNKKRLILNMYDLLEG